MGSTNVELPEGAWHTAMIGELVHDILEPVRVERSQRVELGSRVALVIHVSQVRSSI